MLANRQMTGHDFHQYHTVIQLTLKNANPETRLASLVTIAGGLCYEVESKRLDFWKEGDEAVIFRKEVRVPEPKLFLESPTNYSGRLFGKFGQAIPLSLETVTRKTAQYKIHELGPVLSYDRQLLWPKHLGVAKQASL